MIKPRSIKLLLLGALAVGKSSVARRLSFDTFDHDYRSTIGVQLYKLDVEFDGKTIPVVVWDTDGDMEEGALTSAYARGSSGALIIGDVQRHHTLEMVGKLADAMDEHLPGRPFVCVFNKVDAAAAKPEAKQILASQGHMVLETSVPKGAGVREALQALVDDIVARQGKLS